METAAKVSQSTKKSNVGDLNFKIVELAIYSEKSELIGGDFSQIALKNVKSYALATTTKGLLVIENGNQIFLGKLPGKYARLSDITYSRLLNCYLICVDRKIFRKDVDNEPPYRFLKISVSMKYGNSIRISEMNKRMIVNSGKRVFYFVNLITHKTEWSLKGLLKSGVQDFEIFGSKENKLVYLTSNGSLFLYNLDLKRRRVLSMSWLKCEGDEEDGSSLAVSPQHKYICVELGLFRQGLCSRIILYEVKTNFLSLVAQIHPFDQGVDLGWKKAFCGVGCIQDCALFLGLTMLDTGQFLQVYKYDIKTNKFSEMENNRIEHQEQEPMRIQRIEDSLYYTGMLAKVMRIGFDLK